LKAFRAAALLVGVSIGVLPAIASAEGASAGRPAARTQKSKVRHPVFTGYLAPESKLRVQPLKKPSGDLEISSVNEPKRQVRVNLYNPDGSFNDSALEQLNRVWRCRRTESEKEIDPHLYEILSHVYDHFKKPLTLISGFRNQRRTTSFHYIGSASDIAIPGVPDRQLKEFVESLDTGGMGIGIYPHAGFIHVDIRPEPSYRWIDYSPPGSSDMGQPKNERKRAPNT
jgi:uncharacterized protein YcbK (DUF882 family)